jgi:hypothetical protein
MSNSLKTSVAMGQIKVERFQLIQRALIQLQEQNGSLLDMKKLVVQVDPHNLTLDFLYNIDLLKEKLKNIFDYKILYGDLAIIDDPMKRCFRFTDDSEEFLVLSLIELKCLPESIRKFFTTNPKNAKDIVFSLREWVQENR